MPKKLTDAAVERMALPATGAKITWDAVQTGLGLKLTAAGRRLWIMQAIFPGAKHQAKRTLGEYDVKHMPVAKARERAAEWRALIRQGIDPSEHERQEREKAEKERKAQEAAMRVEDLVVKYLKRQEVKRSHAAIKRRLEKNVVPLIGDVKLADLHRRDITRCLEAVVERGANVEANRVFEDVRAMVRWARGTGDLDANIMEGMPRPGPNSQPRERWLTADEIRVMWNNLPKADMRESTRRIIRLCLLTGQRIGEVAGMELEEYNSNEQLWTIPAHRSKNGRKHAVPISDMADAIIAEQHRDASELARRKGRPEGPYLFPAPGGGAAVSGHAVAKAIRRNEAVLGVEPFAPHDLRRSVASHLEELEFGLIVPYILNHVSATKGTVTGRHYGHYTYAKEMRKALDVWAARLAAIVEGQAAEIVPLRA